MEKISKTHIRKALVDRIKETGLKEIEEEKILLKERIHDLDLREERDYEYFDYIIRELTALNYLKEYLKDAETMFDYEAAYEDLDKIYYVIHFETLEIWLEDGIVGKYLSHLYANEIEPHFLTDQFFGYRSNFVSFFDKVEYDYKKNKGENK